VAHKEEEFLSTVIHPILGFCLGPAHSSI